jgi:hypothetical protein
MNPFLQGAFFPGVLSQGQTQQDQKAGALTNNARGSMSPYISQPEALMRMGGAMMAGSTQGGLAGLSAGVDAYGQMRDYNRNARANEEMAAAERQRIENMMNKQSQPKKNQPNLGQLKGSLEQMNELIGILGDDNMTGPFAGRVQAWADKSGYAGEAGVRRAYARKLLQGFKVDDTLLRTAETKGAISDREMALFESPLPDLNEDEGVWIKYLEDRADVIRKVLAANGVDTSAGPAPANAAPGNTTVTDADLDAFLNPS